MDEMEAEVPALFVLRGRQFGGGGAGGGGGKWITLFHQQENALWVNVKKSCLRMGFSSLSMCVSGSFALKKRETSLRYYLQQHVFL